MTISPGSPLSLSEAELLDRALALEWRSRLPWSPHTPTPPQARFLGLTVREALYGGAAGGGKSDALLMAALQHVESPRYSAILFRRSFTDLALPGALMDRAKSWLMGRPGVEWNDNTKRFTFDSGATITFGYLEHENDKYRYQGAEFQFIGFDELTQFTESQFRYLLSRCRKTTDMADVPLRVRAASNPGGEGHDWVFQRFFTEAEASGRVFVPAKLEDNPHLDREEYERSLAELDSVTRAQLRDGDWHVRAKGPMFDRAWFKIVDSMPAGARLLRYWDLAATEAKPGKDPDWTVGALVGLLEGQWFIDLVRTRSTPKAVEDLVRATGELDSKRVPVTMEQEPGSSGVNTIDHYARKVLVGYTFRGDKKTGSKVDMAKPLSAAAERGNVHLVRGAWNGAFLDEASAFPFGTHDDMVDASSGGMRWLSDNPVNFSGISDDNRPKWPVRM